MKKIVFLLMSIMLSLTACAKDDLASYKEAIEKTESIERGRMNLSIKTDLEFNTEGLSETEIRDLSYFDQMEFALDIQYDESDEKDKAIVKSYYNFGGMGFDMSFYFDGEQGYMKMPIIEKYISFSDLDFEEQQNKFDEDSYSRLVEPLVNKWNELLQQENVFKGKKTYVLTNEGQIKTTTYSIEASEEQLKALGDEVIRVIKEEEIIETFIKQGMKNNDFAELDGIDTQEIIEQMEAYVGRMALESFSGMAYVDFDGRVIKEVYEAKIIWIDTKKGEPTSVKIYFESKYSDLGKEQIFDYPTIQEDEWIKLEDLDKEAFFPEGVF